MRKTFFLLITLMAFFSSIVANAGILVEPYGGYVLDGTGTSGYTYAGDYDHKYTSPIYGGRLGLKISRLFGGVDYSIQEFKLKSTQNSESYKDKVKKEQTGAFIGLVFPNVRFWGTYFLKGEIKGKSDNGDYVTSNDKYNKMSGYGVGLGFSPVRFISFNLEYRSMKYKQSISSGLSNEASYSKKLNLKEIMLSLSFPFFMFDNSK